MGHSIAAIIPLYNGEAFIRESLESVLAQTVPVDEIIVVDDGSSDKGPAVVQAVMDENPKAPIRLLQKENGGQSSARNLGMASTACDLVALLDQDDIWYPNHIALLRAPFERGETLGVDLAYGNLDRIDLAGRLVDMNYLDACASTHPKTSRRQCLSADLHILPGASLLRRSAVERAGGFDERLSGYEDDDLFLRMFSQGSRLVYLNVAVTKWRIHSGSTSFSPRMARSRMIYFFKLVEHFPDEPGIGSYWTSDCIAPRFLKLAVCDFLDGLRLNDRRYIESGMESAKQIAPYLPASQRRTFHAMLPVVKLMLRLSLNRLAGKWVERVIEA